MFYIHRETWEDRFRIFIFQILIGLSVAVPTWGLAQQSSPPPPSVVLENILQDIRHLSHPQYEGRQAGTDGGWQAANYVINRFKTLGLQPGRTASAPEMGPGWLQQQPIQTVQVMPSAKVVLSFFDPTHTLKSVELHTGKDFLPVLDTPSSHVRAPVVFVGYGIVDSARGIDQYHGMDAHNRIVLFLRGKPASYPTWVTHEEKAAIAKERGAAGYLTVTGPKLDPYEARKGLGQIPLAIYSAPPDVRPLSGGWIHGERLDQILQSTNLSLEELQQSADDFRNFHSRPLPLLADLHWESHALSGTFSNVIGILPGHDPQQRNEIILIGAHRDHFGYQAGILFPGADDNASGTAVLLELARVFLQGASTPKRTILFVSFDGEERGLLGSTLYVNNPVLPLEQTMGMVNLDHLGIGNGKLTVGVTRMEKTLVQQAAEHAGLPEQVQIYGYFPGGDHVPFYEAGVPTITVVSSGRHSHFHQPSDTVDAIQPEVLETSAKFIQALINLLANPS